MTRSKAIRHPFFGTLKSAPRTRRLGRSGRTGRIEAETGPSMERILGRDLSGRHIRPPKGRYAGRPIPMTGNSGMTLETFDWLGLGLIMHLRATAIARRPHRPIPGRGARDGPFWTIRSSLNRDDEDV